MAELASMQYVSEIEGCLTELATNIYQRGKLNLTDIHVLSEDFYAGLLNIVYGLHLKNANTDKPNAEGIDLVDDAAKVLIQVSATCKKSKIDHSLSEINPIYAGYHFRFLPLIVGTASSQKRQTYAPPHGVVFDPKKDIIEVYSLIKELQSDTTGTRLAEASAFLRKNLRRSIPSTDRLMSGLEYVISELSKDGSEDPDFDVTPFRIEAKVAFNGLSYGQDVINEYTSHYTKVDRIYSEYTKQGQNKSKSVLQKLHKIYLHFKQESSGDTLFRQIERELVSQVNAANMPAGFSVEELEMCVDILMVHAFMECKIFEKPV